MSGCWNFCSDSASFWTVSMSLTLNTNYAKHKVIYSAKQKDRISTTLSTPQGPLRQRNFEYLVFKENMQEVLLSQPLLKCIGFDLERRLADVREVFHNTYFLQVGLSSDMWQSPATVPHIRLICLARPILNPTPQPRSTGAKIATADSSDDVEVGQEERDTV